MLPLVLALALAKGPVAIVVSSKRAGAETYAHKLASTVQSVLEREGVKPLLDEAAALKALKQAGYSDPRNCQGAQECVAKLAVLIGPEAVVVSIDVGKVANALAVHLEAVGADHTVLATSDFSPSVQHYADEALAPITVFARSVSQGLAAPAIAAQPAPEPVAPEPVKLTRARPAPESSGIRKPLAFALIAVAALSAGGAVTFGLSGQRAQQTYSASQYMLGNELASHLPQSDLNTLAAAGNLRMSLALGGAVLTAILAAISIALLVTD